MELSNTFTVAEPIEVTWPVLCDIERIAPCMPGAQLTEVDGEVFSGEVKLKVGPIKARFKGTAEMVERDDDAHRAVLKAKGKDTGGKGNADATITATAERDGDGTRVTITTDLSITGKVAQFGRGALDDVSHKLLGQFVDCLETNVLAGEAADGTAEDDAASGEGHSSGGGAAPEDAPATVGEGSTPAPTPAAAGVGSPVATAPTPPPGGMPAGTAATGGEAAAGTPGAAAATSTVGSGPASGTAGPGPRKIEGPEAEPIDLLDATGGADAAKRAAGPMAAVMALFFVIWWWRRRR